MSKLRFESCYPIHIFSHKNKPKKETPRKSKACKPIKHWDFKARYFSIFQAISVFGNQMVASMKVISVAVYMEFAKGEPKVNSSFKERELKFDNMNDISYNKEVRVNCIDDFLKWFNELDRSLQIRIQRIQRIQRLAAGTQVFTKGLIT